MEVHKFLLVFLFADFAHGQHFFFPDDEKITRRVPLSEQKCNEYNEPIAGELMGISLMVDAEPIKSNIPTCNYDGIPLIVGGTPAVPGEFPFMAALGWRDNNKVLWKCGGTLISEKFVMTAGHCLWERSFGVPVLVRLGEHDLSNLHDNAVDFGIARIIKHPEHSFQFKYNDIALLELNETVIFSKWIRPACLWNKNEIEASAAVATGWGLTNPGDSDSSSDRLLKVKLKIIPNSDCGYENYASRSLANGIVDSMLCAGDLENSKDTCPGDSGGPLFITREGRHCQFYVVGITSFGKRCGIKRPGVYTRISSFIKWIEETVW